MPPKPHQLQTYCGISCHDGKGEQDHVQDKAFAAAGLDMLWNGE